MSQTGKVLCLGIRSELAVIIGVLAAFTLTVYVWPAPAIRTVLGLCCLLLLPGYALTSALFPRRDSLNGVERAVLCFGASIVSVSLIGLLLNYTPWGVRLEPMLVAVGSFVLWFTAVAYYQRSRLAAGERFVIRVEVDADKWRNLGLWDKLLYAALALSALAAVGALIYAFTGPKVGERFTEFYLLGPDRTTDNYPRQVLAGEPITLVIGLVNREHADTVYRIAKEDSAGVEQIATLPLRHEEKWESPYTFALTTPGENQRVTFWLYRGDDPAPYRELHLWITVRGAAQEP